MKKTTLILALVMTLTGSLLAQSGQAIRQQRNLDNFSGVDVGGAFDVFIEKGERFSVVVEADEAIIDRIETYVNDDILFIETKGWNMKSRTLNIYIVMPSLREINAHGAVDIQIEKGFRSTGFLLEATGSADISLDMEVRRLEGSISGSVDLTMRGSAETMNIEVSGSSDLKARNFMVKSAEVSVSGASDVHIHVTEKLSGSASGASDLYVSGAPASRAITTSGASDVIFSDR